MAVYTTFFLCKPAELANGFPGWRLPLATPVRREFRNPFTGKVSVIETREPEWPDQPDDESEREYQVVRIGGSYEDYLESRLPQFVRACPHWAAKGLTETELGPLLKAAGVAASMECAVYSPPNEGGIVQQFPPALLAKFGSLDQKAIAEQWAAAMSTPEHTHSMTGVKLSDGWSMSDARGILQPLVALAHRATAGQQMYLLIEV